MAVITRRTSASQRTRDLAERLAVVLRESKTGGQPLITENQIAQTKSLHVVVIWDEWKDLRPAERSEIIADAYAKARRLRGRTLTVAMGLSGEEALRLGFLPYGIVTTRRQADDATADELSAALANAGGILVRIGSSAQLRFATLEQAENAYRCLSQKVPGPYWAILKEQPVAE